MLKKVILVIIILEVLNIAAGYIKNGASIFLPYAKFNAPALYYDMDSLYGVTRQKNVSELVSYPWGSVPYETNSMGFRDDVFNPKSILVVGNSFIEGFGIKKEDRFTELLEDKYGYKFNNAGTSGVWTPIQSWLLIKNLLKNKKIESDKVLLFITPNELSNIGNRNPKNDPSRNYPYRLKDSIDFYKSSNNSFSKNITNKSKIKRLLKSTLFSKLYTSTKYYGASKKKNTSSKFDLDNFLWFLTQIENEKITQQVEVIIINNLMNNKIRELNKACSDIRINNIKIHVIDFPSDQNLYFTSNGHINENGHKALANLIVKTIEF